MAESAAALVGLSAIVTAIWVWRSTEPGQTPAPPAIVRQISAGAGGAKARSTATPTGAPLASVVVSATLAPPPTLMPLAPTSIEHTIVSGDSLWGLALEHDVTVEAILAANIGTLTLDRLSIGQVIKVPLTDVPPVAEAPAPESTAVAAAEDTITDTVQAAVVAASAAGPLAAVVVSPAVSVTVAPADTLSTLAEANGVAVADVVAANGLESADVLIQSGQVLVMKTAVVVTATPLPGGSASGQPGSDAGQAALQEPMNDQTDVYAAPLVLAPPANAVLSDDAPVLRWSSIGPLPPGTAYIVLLREADAEPAKAVRVFVRGGATALRIPARFRPALGATRRLAFAVAVGRVGEGLLGADDGLILSGDPRWIDFTWSLAGEGAAVTALPGP